MFQMPSGALSHGLEPIDPLRRVLAIAFAHGEAITAAAANQWDPTCVGSRDPTCVGSRVRSPAGCNPCTLCGR